VSDVNPECYNDAWSLNTIDMRWSRKSSDMVSWFPREGHSAVFVRGKMFLFGGCQLTSECYNDVAVLDTAEPCPALCGGHGTCNQGQFCRCTAGFTGHDCMQPLTCPRDCSGRGQCTEAGTCACDNGWGGADCNIDIPCPGSPTKCFGQGKCLNNGQCQCFQGYSGTDCAAGSALCPGGCSGHGYCSATSQCVCHQGFSGIDCSTVLLAGIQEGHQSSKVLVAGFQPSHAPEAKNLTLVAQTIHHGHAYMPPHKKNAMPTPTGATFGIPEVNDIGHTGVQTSSCDDNCFFRGVCRDGTCFCQPGFYGKKCQMEKTSEKGTVSLVTALLIGGGCALVSFSIMTLLLHLSMQSKRAKETELGYNI